MNADQTHVVDQAVAAIAAKLDNYRTGAAADLPDLGYEATVAKMHQFLITAQRRQPQATDALIAIAAVAIVQLARHDLGGEL